METNKTQEQQVEATQTQTQNSRIEATNGEAPQAYDVNYIEAIKEMKKNSVSRSEYDKLMEENRNLVNTLMEGGTLEGEKEPPVIDYTEEIKGLRKELYGPDGFNGSDLDYVKKTLQLREDLIKCGEPDPMLPWGKKISPTQEDIDKVENMVKVYQECIDYAEGDNAVFINELMRQTNDIMRPKRK